MNITGIICEYNPFHNGHLYQLSEAKRLGADIIICMMSGNAVQRGEFAIADKYVRSEAAVRAGADLVLELPFPYSCSGGDFFARAAVSLLGRLGVGSLCFGSESADVPALEYAAGVTLREDFISLYKQLSGKETGTARAWCDAYRTITGDDIPGGGNDTLGISYLRAVYSLGLDIKPMVIKRLGTGYSDVALDNTGYPSSRALRHALLLGQDIPDGQIPENVSEVYRSAQSSGRFPVLTRNIGQTILQFWRCPDIEKVNLCTECGNGTAGFISTIARKSPTYDIFVSGLHTKKYTDTRLQRAVLSGICGITLNDLRTLPAFTTLLAANSAGRSYLASTRNKTDLHITVKPADADLSDPVSARQAELSSKFDSLYTLAMPMARDAGFFMRMSPFIYN